MSSVRVTDLRGGKYQTTIEFTYGECERLPFNLLRRINARIEVVQQGGVKAVADFNIRVARDSAAFLEVLNLFGDEGSFVHGSAADPEALAKNTPPENGGTIYVSLNDEDDDLELEGALREK